MTDPTYSIRDWDRHFECAQSRRNSGPSRWFPVQTAHDGRGYRRLMKQPNGVALYGAWILIVAVAAKCPRRGVLAAVDGPLTADDLALKTDAPTEIFAEALRILANPDIGIGWLICAQSRSAVGALSERAPSTVGDISERAQPSAATDIQTDIQTKKEKPRAKVASLSDEEMASLPESKRELARAMANGRTRDVDPSKSLADALAVTGGAP